MHNTLFKPRPVERFIYWNKHMHRSYKFSLIMPACAGAALAVMFGLPATADAQGRAARRLILQAEAYCNDLREFSAARGIGCYAELKPDGSGSAMLEPPGVNSGAKPTMDSVMKLAHEAAVLANQRRLSLRLVIFTAKTGTTTSLDLPPEATEAASRAGSPEAARGLIRQMALTCTYRGLVDEPICRKLSEK